MSDLSELAQTIADLTDVVTDAPGAQPGKPVHINVLPGFNSSLLTVVAGGLGLPPVTLLDEPAVAVKFDVKRREFDPNTMTFTFKSTTDFTATPPLNSDPNVSDPLEVAFLLIPAFGEDTTATEPTHYRIDVTLTVTVEKNKSLPKTISIPVDVPPVQIPSLLLLGKYKDFATYGDDGAGSMIVMVRTSSPLRDLGAVVTALNRVTGVLKTLQSVIDFFHSAPGSPPGSPPDPNGFSALGIAASLIGAMPFVYFSIGNVRNIDDLEDDDYGQALLLIGATNKDSNIPAEGSQDAATVPGVTQVTLFGQNDYSRDVTIGDAEYRTFSLGHDTEIVIKRAGLPDLFTGVGVTSVKPFIDLTGMNWAGDDPGENMNNSTNSVRWGGADKK